MRVLLDTHVILWALFEPGRLSPVARAIIEDPENEVFASAVSFWEISLKFQIGKLELVDCVPDELPPQVVRMGIELLPLDSGLLASSDRLPLKIHRDPFDRMLAWHAMGETLTLVTRDRAFEEYRQSGLNTLW